MKKNILLPLLTASLLLISACTGKGGQGGAARQQKDIHNNISVSLLYLLL